MSLINNNLACIIVTYNPDKEMLDSIVLQILKSAVSIYIVDNRYSDASSFYLKNLAAKFQNRINITFLEKNHGIAKALNVGVEKARFEQHKYAFLLDQDSIPQDGLLDEMKAAAERLSIRDPQVVAIGPRLYDPRSNQFFKFASLKWGLWKKIGCDSGSGELIKCDFINSSGSMIFLDQWERIGLFSEELFIDHVETDWYMRARYFGLNCYGLCTKSNLVHHMGDKVCRYWFFGWRYMPHRSPERHYTIVRNAIWLWRRHYTPFSWIINSICKIIFTLFYFSIFDNDRGKQFSFITKGIFDGVSGEPLKN